MARRWLPTTRQLWIALATGLIGGAALVAYAPGLLPAAVRRAAENVDAGVDAHAVLLFAGSVIVIAALLLAWLWRTNDPSERFVSRRPAVSDRGVRIAGRRFERAFERRRDADSVSALESSDDTLEATLRRILVDTYAFEFDDRETARDYVDQGEWTTDQYAAAFLTTTQAIDYPLGHRLYAWLYPGAAYEVRVRHALRAVETTAAEYFPGYEPPVRERTRLQRWRVLFGADPPAGEAETRADSEPEANP